MDGFIYDILIKSENYIIVLSKKKCPLIFERNPTQIPLPFCYFQWTRLIMLHEWFKTSKFMLTQLLKLDGHHITL